MKIVFYFLLFSFLINFQIVYAQKRISSNEAKADIDTYYESIKKVHPNMYWHTTAKIIEDHIDSLKRQCKDSIDIGTFSYLLAQSNHFFDYHTKCPLSGEISTDIFLPSVEYRTSGIFWENQRIKSINHIPVEKIISQIKKCIGADVPLETGCFELNHSIWGQKVMAYMGLRPPFELRMFNTDSLYKLEGISYAELKQQQTLNKPTYSFECFPENSIAIIHYNQCIMNKFQEFEHFLKNSFADIQKNDIKYLFIDVSQNAGGNSNTSTKFLKYLYFTKRKKYVLLGKVKNDRNQLRKEKSRIIVRASSGENKFRGTIFIFQSYATRSAGPFLGEFLKSMSRAILVGTETEATVPAYSNALWQRLPFSGLKYGVSQDYYYKERSKIPRSEIGGVLPDITYPFVELKLEHCLNIINLYKLNKVK